MKSGARCKLGTKREPLRVPERGTSLVQSAESRDVAVSCDLRKKAALSPYCGSAKSAALGLPKEQGTRAML